MSVNFFKCSLCTVKKFNLEKYFVHFKFAHESQANFSVTCRISGCPRTYNKVKALREHMRIMHAEI